GGAHFVATTPLLASFLDRPFEPSPYVPVSRLFWNEIFMSIRPRVTEAKASLKHDDAVLAAAVEEARRLNARATVPYREAMALKRRVLGKFTRRFSLQDPAYQAGGHPAAPASTADYARFRAAVERLGPSWRNWPEDQRAGRLTPSDYDPETAAFYAQAQESVRSQLLALAQDARRSGMRLYLDLPVGVHNDGYDAWRFRGLFAEGVSMGAPPDPFAREGQIWGFQPLKPEALRACGYEYMRACLRHHLEAAQMLRIDHAIGLHRVFCIPAGGSGRDGVFVRQPSEEIYAILSLESHRHQAVIIGEDLGLVPSRLRRDMREHGISGAYVQIFGLTGDEQRPLRPPRRRSVASWGTHDLPPFAAWWTDADLEGRVAMGLLDADGASAEADARRGLKRALENYLRRRGLLDNVEGTADVFRGSLRLLAESKADWVQVNLEDTWGETRSQNVPGTTDAQHPNWRRRAAYALEELEALPGPASAFVMLRELRP
ncbi:MAG TPA: 4-alpha-glucanotransferase, partial [Dehalococcoidia bacterium]|nr:4-alpha-glucanotransferase [Dehalococcoidia bacterium]